MTTPQGQKALAVLRLGEEWSVEFAQELAKQYGLEGQAGSSALVMAAGKLQAYAEVTSRLIIMELDQPSPRKALVSNLMSSAAKMYDAMRAQILAAREVAEAASKVTGPKDPLLSFMEAGEKKGRS